MSTHAPVQKKLLVGKSAVFAGTLPAEWGGPGSFPQLELLSISMTHISGGALTTACTYGMHENSDGTMYIVLKHLVDCNTLKTRKRLCR